MLTYQLKNKTMHILLIFHSIFFQLIVQKMKDLTINEGEQYIEF